jgi:hypothetical protein
MDLGKLERSLLRRVIDRVQHLLPEADVSVSDGLMVLQWNTLDAQFSLGALATACHAVDRKEWGGLTGWYCNLVVAHVRDHFREVLSGDDELTQIIPLIVAASPLDDSIMESAMPTPDLQTAHMDWLAGFRVEFVRSREGKNRRVCVRDVKGLGETAESLLSRAIENLEPMTKNLKMDPLGDDELLEKIVVINGPSVATAALLSAGIHHRMFTLLSVLGDSPAKRILCVAPRSTQVFFCDVKEVAAVAAMVAKAWTMVDDPKEEGFPLSPRLFAVKGEGDVALHDVGLPSSRVPDWVEQDLEFCTLRTPSDWSMDEGDRGILLSAAGGEVRIQAILDRSAHSTAFEVLQRAEDHAELQGVEEPIQTGFFQGLPWAWVDGQSDKGAMFVGLSNGLVTFEIFAPEGTSANLLMTIRKVLATIIVPTD